MAIIFFFGCFFWGGGGGFHTSNSVLIPAKHEVSRILATDTRKLLYFSKTGARLASPIHTTQVNGGHK